MVVTQAWNMPQGNETLWLCKYATNKIYHKVNFCVKFYSMHNPISSNHLTRSINFWNSDKKDQFINWSDEMNVFTSTIDIFTVDIYLYGRHIIRFCMLMYTIERQVQFGNLTHMFKKIRPQMCAWEVIPNIFWFCSIEIHCNEWKNSHMIVFVI